MNESVLISPLAAQFEYVLTCTPELDVRPCDDLEGDGLAFVLEQMEWNVWAWCVVRVVATVELNGRTFTSSPEYLGACSYGSEADFRADGYFSDMCDTARADLLDLLHAAARAVAS